MRTREKSKAQLLRELKAQEHRINVLETRVERLKEEYNMAATDRAKVSDDMFRQAAAHDRVLADHERKLTRVRGELQERHNKVLELEGQVNMLMDQVRSYETQVVDLTNDRRALSTRLEESKEWGEGWVQKHSEKEREFRRMEKLFLKQAELAGETARLNPFNH